MVYFFVEIIYMKKRLLKKPGYWESQNIWRCSFIFASLKNIFYDTYYRWWVKVQQWMIMVILIYYFYILTHSTNSRKNRIILQWNIIDCRFLYTFHTTTVIKLRKALERWFPLFFINAIICAVFFIFKYFVCHKNESRL